MSESEVLESEPLPFNATNNLPPPPPPGDNSGGVSSTLSKDPDLIYNSTTPKAAFEVS